MPTDPNAISLTIAKDGTATLTGMNYDDLRSIFTAASLHAHDAKIVVNPLDGNLDETVHDNNLETVAWHLNRRLMLDVLEQRMKHAISPKYESGSIERILRLHQFEMAGLEGTVKKLEQEAADKKAGVVPPDPAVEALRVLAAALRQADGAVAILNRSVK